MNNLESSESDGKNSYVLMSDPFGTDLNSARIAHHFLNDPKAKFILSDGGEVLFRNLEAFSLLNAGILARASNGSLTYGSSDLNVAANDILENIRLGRSSHMRLVKKHQDDWIILEFSSVDFNDRHEILLTVYKRNACHSNSISALSKSFDFTITEAEVVRHMSKAYCPKEISAEMDISINTVRAHLRSIYAKIGVRGYNRSLRVILQLTS